MTLKAAWLLVLAGAAPSVSQTADLLGFPCMALFFQFKDSDLKNEKYTVSSGCLTEITTLMPQEKGRTR